MKHWPGLFKGIVSAGCLALSARPVLGGVEVSPVVVRTSTPPGRAAEGLFHVRNGGSDPVAVAVEPESWPPALGKRPVDWLTLEPRQFTLPPGAGQDVMYKAAVPAGARGELGAQVYFASDVPGGQGGTLSLRQRFGCVLYVAAAGTEKYKARVDRVAEKIQQGQRVFEIFVRNRGNVHIRPSGRVRILGPEGKEIAVVPLEGRAPVYAGSTRSSYARVDESLIPAGGRARGIVELWYGRDEAPMKLRKKFVLSGVPAAEEKEEAH